MHAPKVLWVLAALSFGGCPDEERPVFRAQQDPAIGATSFVSAAGPIGAKQGGPTASLPTDDRTNGGEDRTIEEGDIYRVLGDGRVLDLNPYRGLLVIDTATPATPSVIGSLRMSGSPVELYVDGDRAIVLMNDWYGYWGTRDAATYGKEQGGAVVLVDLSDPTKPAILDRVVVPGYVQKSRLAKGAHTTLYVAASLWQLYDAGGGGGTVAVGSSNRTVVRSFEHVGDKLVPRSEVDLGGWVSDIQATPAALLVARTDWSASDAVSHVAVVDITAPDGTMTLGIDIAVAGAVKSQFNLDLQGDILRVVSEGSGGDPRTNHIETFDISDLAHPQAVDDATFGAGESLFATLFVGPDKAFVVTYLRQDPFHAFSIDAAGQVTEVSQFVVSGWNDFFRAALGDTRLVGVGIDDASGGRQLAVSLYDITDLTEPEPLVARVAVGLESAWSEANWDHRAFSVLEGAVSVPAGAAPATLETGLVLLPFTGWNADGYVSGVRLFTFSATTLTARGVLAHETPVRRGFLTDDAVAACLSDEALSLHDVADPDHPAALGAVDLAPSYVGFDIYGNHGVRLVDTRARSYYGTHTPPPARAEVIALAGDPDRADALATFALAPGATLTQVGPLAVALSATWQSDATEPSKSAWETTVAVWDLTNATEPAQRGTLVTRDLPPTYSGWGWDVATPHPTEPARPSRGGAADACFDCGVYRMAPEGTVVGEAIVFLQGIAESAPAGTLERCVTVPPGESTEPGEPGTPDGTDPRPTPSDANATADAGVYYRGRIECVRGGEGPETCYGGIYACQGLDLECVVVPDPATIGAKTTCQDEQVLRYWTRYVLHVLDLSDAMQPTVRDPIALPVGEEGMALVRDGNTLWVATREPYEVAGDVRDFVKYFVRAVDLANPGAPVVGTRINVPGILVAVAGSDLYTVDAVYDDDHLETAVSRLAASDGLATLVARRRYDDRQAQSVLLDGAGHVLVSHGPSSWWYGYAVDARAQPTTWETRLDVLAVADLGVLASVPVDTWAELKWAAAGLAIFQVPGGLLAIDLTNPAAPRPKAWFATAGWPGDLVVAGSNVYVAAGLFGLYRFDLGDFALLPPD